MRCPTCGYELGAKSPPAGETVPCPKCRREVVGELLPSVGVEPLPPRRGSSGWREYVSKAIPIGIVLVFGLLVIACFMPGYSPAYQAAYRSSCGNNLKQIALALHNYHDTYKALPAQSITDGSGRPMHSWRIAILPFLESTPLYDRYDFDQPWDSPRNREVGKHSIPIFRCPAGDVDESSNLTNYFVVYGDETMFAPDRWIKLSDVTDGLSNTIMVVECDSPLFRVEWSEPRDIPFDQMSFRINPPNGIGVSSGHEINGGVQVAMGDGSVRFLMEGAVDERTFRYSLIRNDGQNVLLP